MTDERINLAPADPEVVSIATVAVAAMPQADRFVIELTADGDGPPVDVRLRRWLKLGLRVHGLRCTGAAAAPTVPAHAMPATNTPGRWRRLSKVPKKDAVPMTKTKERKCRYCSVPLTEANEAGSPGSCKVCHNLRNHHRRAWRRRAGELRDERRRDGRRLYENRRAATWPTATKLYQCYSTADQQVLLDGDIPDRQAALLLNRTAAAVNRKRHRLAESLGLPAGIRAHATSAAKHVPPRHPQPQLQPQPEKP